MKKFLKKGTISITLVLKKQLPDVVAPVDADDTVSVEIVSENDGSRYVQYSSVAADVVSVGLDTSGYRVGVYFFRITVATKVGIFSSNSEEFEFTDTASLANANKRGRAVETFTITTIHNAESELPDDIQDILADPTRGSGGLIKATYFYRYMVAWANNIDPVTGQPISPDVKMPRIESVVDTANAWSILMIMARLKAVESGGGGTTNWFYKFVDKVYDPLTLKGNAVTGLSVSPTTDPQGNHIVTIEYDKTFLNLLSDALQTVKSDVTFEKSVNINEVLTLGEPAPARAKGETNDEFKARFEVWYKRINDTVAGIIYGGLKVIGDAEVDGSLDVKGNAVIGGTLMLEGNTTNKVTQTETTKIIDEVGEQDARIKSYSLVTLNIDSKNKKRSVIKAINKVGNEVFLAVDDIKSAHVAGWSFRIDGVEVARIDGTGISGGGGTDTPVERLLPVDSDSTIGLADRVFGSAFINNIFTKAIKRTYTEADGSTTLNIGIYQETASNALLPDVEIILTGTKDSVNSFKLNVNDKVDSGKNVSLKLNADGFYFNDTKLAPREDAIWETVNGEDFVQTIGNVGKTDTIRTAIYKVQTQISAIVEMYTTDIHVNSGADNKVANGSVSFPYRTLTDALAAVDNAQNKVIRIWRLEGVEEVVISDITGLTIRGEFDAIKGRPTVRSLQIGANVPRLIIEHLSVERDTIINNSVDRITFNACELIGSLINSVTITGATVRFTNCEFGACEIRNIGGTVKLNYCVQDPNGFYSQTSGDTNILSGTDFSVYHNGGKIKANNTNFTFSAVMFAALKAANKDVNSLEGIYSDAVDTTSNSLFLYGGSMASDGVYSALAIESCAFSIAGLARDAGMDRTFGQRIAKGIQDIDIISNEQPGTMGYLSGATIAEKFEAINLALSSPVNLLRNSNILVHPETYGIATITADDVINDSVLINHTQGAGAKVSVTIPKKYRSYGKYYTATLELSVNSIGQYNIIASAEAGIPLIENIVTVEGLSSSLVPITFEWTEDADVVLSWQVNDATGDLVVYNGVMLALGDYTGVWKECVYDSYTIADRSDDIVLSPKLNPAGAIKICQVNKTTLHLEVSADNNGITFTGTNELISGVPLKDLDKAFINGRVIPVSFVPEENSIDCVFQGYAKLIDDKVVLTVRKTLSDGVLKSIAFSVDFNITNPSFIV